MRRRDTGAEDKQLYTWARAEYQPLLITFGKKQRTDACLFIGEMKVKGSPSYIPCLNINVLLALRVSTAEKDSDQVEDLYLSKLHTDSPVYRHS